MAIMKKFILICVFLLTGLLAHGQQFPQEGAYLDNKPHGMWVEYDLSGEVKTIAHYDRGLKVGTWVFIHNDTVKEVKFNKNKIVKVTHYKKEEVAYVQ